MTSDTPSIRTRCCVVGGGPAGMMVATLLARAGVESLVLERDGTFERDSGILFHPATMDIIGELGWLGDLLQRCQGSMARVRAQVGTRDVITLADFSRSRTRMRSVALLPQRDFLEFLERHATAFPAFSLRMGTRVLGPLVEVGRVVGVCAEDDGGRFEVRADLVVAADGRSSALRATLGASARVVESSIDVLRFRVPRVDSDPVDSLGWSRRGHMLVLTAGVGSWEIAWLIAKGGFESLRAAGIEAFRREVARTAPFLRDRVGLIRRFEDVELLPATIDRLERWWRPGLLFLGEAAHCTSPVAGLGVNLALQDAVAAANALSGPLLRNEPLDVLLPGIQHRRELPTRAALAAQWAVQKRIGRALAEGRPNRNAVALRVVGQVPLLQSLLGRAIGAGLRPEHVGSPFG